MARHAAGGIYCLEAEWHSDLRKRPSVRHLLELLKSLDAADFIYRDIGTIEELKFYFNEWRQQRYKKYSIGYIAGHGVRGALSIGYSPVPLSELARTLSGSCRGRILHFGSCETLRMSQADLEEFQAETNADAVCGYTKSVDWVESAAFELVMLEALIKYSRPGSARNYLERKYGDMVERLGFTMITRRRSLSRL